MANNNKAIFNDFDIKEFVETNTSSASRTRWITIVLVLASVVIGIGFYNSMKFSWATYRVESLKNFENFPENVKNPKSLYEAVVGHSDFEPKPLLDIYFGKNDFLDKEGEQNIYKGYGFKKFACRFKKPEELDLKQIVHYIHNSLNIKSKQLIEEQCNEIEKAPDGDNLGEFIEVIKGDLNRLIKDKFLYSQERFQCILPEQSTSGQAENGINLNGTCIKSVRTEEAKKIIAIATEETDSILKLKEGDLMRMNRLLLEEAFKGEILESRIMIPSDEKIMSKEIPSRIAFDDKVYFVEMPFFDIPIDVNDLGLIGGISLYIILCLLRFSQSREIKNLKLSFREAVRHDKLSSFYHSLAMHQVLTVPKMDGEVRNKQLAMSAKWIYFLPIVVLILGVGYDYYSVFKYNLFEWTFVWRQLYFQIIPCIVLVFLMSIQCLERQFHIDEVWNSFYFIRRESDLTLKIKYENAKNKTERNKEEEEIVRIYEIYFSEDPPKERFRLIKLLLSGLYNLKVFLLWIFHSLSKIFHSVKKFLAVVFKKATIKK